MLAANSPLVINYLARRGNRQPAHEIFKLRSELGEFHHLYPNLRLSNDMFKSYARMDVSTFDYIVESIKPELQLSSTNFQDPITVEERLRIKRILFAPQTRWPPHFTY